MTTTFTPIDLSRLPAPTVVEQIDYEVILAERKAYFISLHPSEKQAAIAANVRNMLSNGVPPVLAQA